MVQLKEERLLHSFVIHHAQERIVVDETKRIADRLVIVDHGGADFAAIFNHTYTRFCMTCLQEEARP